MKPVTVAEWTAALRSGGYTQSRGRLREAHTDENSIVRCCAVGVLLELADTAWQVSWADGRETVWEIPPLAETAEWPAWAQPHTAQLDWDGTRGFRQVGPTDGDLTPRHLIELGEAGRFLAQDGRWLLDLADDGGNAGPARPGGRLMVDVITKANDGGLTLTEIADLIDHTHTAWVAAEAEAERCPR